MPQADYPDLGRYIRRQNPYSTSPQLPGTLGSEGGPGVLTVDDKNAADPWVLNWDFREPAAFDSVKKWDVVNYRVSRVVVVPTWYEWENPPKGSYMRILYANILIGYTPPAPVSTLPPYRTFADTPGGNGTGDYGELGELISARFPFSDVPELGSDVDPNGDLSNVVIAESFLDSFSAASGNVFQLNGDAMDLTQRQQCLYWDGPKRIGDMPPPPTAGSTQDGTFDSGAVINYQITKAFRVPYRFDTAGGTTMGGLILVGYNGSGDG